MKSIIFILFFLVFFITLLHTQQGPLGEWPDFTPIGFITAPHPQNPNVQTHLYGDWGGIVGEEFLVIQDSLFKLLYHSYHETYMTQHPLQEEFLHDWELGYNPITFEKYTPLVCPGGPNPGPAWDHTDTPSYIQHPISGEHLLYNTVRPGTKYLHPEWNGLPGWEGAIQVATSDTTPQIGVPFYQNYENILEAELWWENGWNNNGIIKGGLSEPTPVWVPQLNCVRLFYRGLHAEPNSYFNWRISYADSDDGKTNWTKNPTPSWDPSDPNNPAYQWTQPYPQGFSFRGSWQAHCTGDSIADGVHMVMIVSNQNYAGFGHIAYYWSPDWGDTWIGHPDNPIIAPGQFPDGVPSQGFQRTPTLVVDEEYNRYILAYNAGHDVNEPWRRRTYIATAPRTEVVSSEEVHLVNEIIKLKNFPNPFNPFTTIEFSIQTDAIIDLSIYNLKGQKIKTLIQNEFTKGSYSIIWNGEDESNNPVSTGIYFYKLYVNGKTEAVKKCLLLK